MSSSKTILTRAWHYRTLSPGGVPGLVPSGRPGRGHDRAQTLGHAGHHPPGRRARAHQDPVQVHPALTHTVQCTLLLYSVHSYCSVYTHTVQCTLLLYRYTQLSQVAFPPPFMEREALASRVIDMSPAGEKFRWATCIEELSSYLIIAGLQSSSRSRTSPPRQAGRGRPSCWGLMTGKPGPSTSPTQWRPARYTRCITLTITHVYCSQVRICLKIGERIFNNAYMI